jgi:hypothetical protein
LFFLLLLAPPALFVETRFATFEGALLVSGLLLLAPNTEYKARSASGTTAVWALAANAPMSAGANPPRILRVERFPPDVVADKTGLIQPVTGADEGTTAFAGAAGCLALGLKYSEGIK